MKKVNVYVDGLNLYCGALKGREGCKWLDIRLVCKRLLNADDLDVKSIKYFTALVHSKEAKKRQEKYIDALETDKNTTVIKGEHKNGKEKKTDVNIAINMLHDAVQNEYETAVLISNDSDFVPVIKMVKNEYQKEVLVIRPILNNLHRGRKRGGGCYELEEAASGVRDLKREGIIRVSQYPDLIIHEGHEIKKPDGW